jgi:hypothetical protein
VGKLRWDENWQENEYNEKLKIIKDRKKIICSDFIGFKRIQVNNDIFNKVLSEGYLQRKGYFKISQNERLWFPHLIPHKDWKNEVTDDWNTIFEKCIGDNPKEKVPGKEHNQNIKRYTFAKFRNNLGKTSYRFIGVFKFKGKKRSTFIYERISSELELSTWM